MEPISIDNGVVVVNASTVDGALRLSIAAKSGGAVVPVFERVVRNDVAPVPAVGGPEGCRIRTETIGDSVFLEIDGDVGGCRYASVYRVRDGSAWIECVETFFSGDRPVAAFEADWRIAVDAGDTVDLFSPCLQPEETDVVGRHAMRSPVLTMQSSVVSAALVVAPNTLARTQSLPPSMSLLRSDDAVVFRSGLRSHETRGHVYYRADGRTATHETFHHSYFLYAACGGPPGDAAKAAREQAWSTYGRDRYRASTRLPSTYEEYAGHVYPLVLAANWREMSLEGKDVGAVCINRSYPGDVWMCPWFSQLRTAYGMYIWGERLGVDDWRRKALMTRDLHLAAPRVDGFFPTLFVFGDDCRPPRWVESHHQGGGPGIYHLMDMSWTIHQLLRWHRDLLPSPESIEFARGYCRRLVREQRVDGSLPAYVDSGTGAEVDRVDRAALIADLEAHPGGIGYIPHQLKNTWPEERFTRSAEDGTSLLALAETAALLPPDDPDHERFLGAARRVVDYLEAEVFPDSRWVDFEVSFSCAPNALGALDKRSGQWAQGTLCLHSAAAGLLRLFEVDGDERFLGLASRAMDRLCLYQQIWDPPFLSFHGFGGYAAMNNDGEWSDARQALFADTHLDFYVATGVDEHRQRGIAACRSGFVTLFSPLSASVYPTGWCRNPRGYGAENHGHEGRDHLCVLSSFDWGIGSALATAGYFRRHDVD